MSRLDRDKVEVVVDSLEPFKNEEAQGFILNWSGNIGLGQYTIYQNVDDSCKWKGDSECMDHPDDKWFIKKLFESFIDQLEVTE